MRFMPAAAVLCALLAVSASVGHADNHTPDPRAELLLEQGRAALGAGQIQRAIDDFEAALAVDPALIQAYLLLAEAARREGLPGKAIHYYRMVLAREPRNFAALAGEGAAMAEKGAIEKARQKLATLESQCGSSCPEAESLRAALARAQAKRMAAETTRSQKGESGEQTP